MIYSIETDQLPKKLGRALMKRQRGQHAPLSVLQIAMRRGTYTRLYHFLKAQRTILASLCQQISESDNPDQDILSLIKSILDANFRNSMEMIVGAVARLQDLYSQTFRPVKYLNNILTALVSLLKLISTLMADHNETTKVSSRSSGDIQVHEYYRENSETVICRLCNSHVPIDVFREHIKVCAAAVQNETRVVEIDAQIRKECAATAEKWLSGPWPGEKKYSVEYSMPVLHLNALLRRALSVEAQSDDAADELEQIIEAMGDIPFMNEHMEDVKKPFDLVEQKLRLAISLRATSDVLRQTVCSSPANKSRVTIADFQFIKRISAGAYARVFLAKKKNTGDVFAIKVTSKSLLTHKNQAERVLTEQEILRQFSSDFIVTFYWSFVGKKNLYMVMEYLPGGDLYSLLQKLGCLDEDVAKLYAMEILYALRFLHNKGIIHRDLKPDNIVVSSKGRLKLTDFGLSHLGFENRQVPINEQLSKAASFVGTPDYMAPEIILNQPHSLPVDYWSFGCIVYEFLFGIPPFHAETEEDTHRNILRGMIDFSDADCSDEALDLIRKLLVQQPAERLGAKGGVDEILAHPWFKGLDIETAKPPFLPQLSSQTDTGYFEQRYEFDAEEDKDILSDIGDTDDPEMKMFESVGVDQLIKQNEVVAKQVEPMVAKGKPPVPAMKLQIDQPIVPKPRKRSKRPLLVLDRTPVTSISEIEKMPEVVMSKVMKAKHRKSVRRGQWLDNLCKE